MTCNCILCRHWLRTRSIAVVLAIGLSGSASAEEPARPVAGIAATYPHDAGIGKDPRVLFADDFDAWETGPAKPPSGTWEAVRKQQESAATQYGDSARQGGR